MLSRIEHVAEGVSLMGWKLRTHIFMRESKTIIRRSSSLANYLFDFALKIDLKK